jgi:hypothetical protein
MSITGEEQREELFRAVLRLLGGSWRAINYRYDGMTPQERECLTRDEHARLVMLLKLAKPPRGTSPGQLAGQLVERAKLYGELAIEGVELEAVAGESYTMDQANRDMDRITASIASGFLVGYGAALDDQHDVPRLGGVAEQERKAGRRKAVKK